MEPDRGAPSYLAFRTDPAAPRGRQIPPPPPYLRGGREKLVGFTDGFVTGDSVVGAGGGGGGGGGWMVILGDAPREGSRSAADERRWRRARAEL